ncbi:FusB/FusC family EF-G-binding protein [Sediminibacillus massiliensis]|uniref:FusB/FusC family EF-G-binding protein n=1 Tax=Sediminibacillus massiliensis TaxID=1926277 RepID=UPI00098833C4|nr:FusB/FusC family EF-G-binding protein [Sediminibacillus massiliensis]
MEPFIQTHQYNFIKEQVQYLVNGHASVNDFDVLKTLESLAIEKVTSQFDGLQEEQKEVLNGITNIQDKEDAVLFLARIKSHVIPFPDISENTIHKLFPKTKKLKTPRLENIDFKETTYLSWIDKGSSKKFIVAPHFGTLIGVKGSFTNSNQKGICTLCNGNEEVGLFVSEEKGTGNGTYVKRGSHICRNSETCNQNITNLKKMDEFLNRIK